MLLAGYSTADDDIGSGLNSVQERAEAHAWDISVTTSETGGAQFSITDMDSAE